MKEIRKQKGEKRDGVILPLAESLANIPHGYTNFINNLKE